MISWYLAGEGPGHSVLRQTAMIQLDNSWRTEENCFGPRHSTAIQILSSWGNSWRWIGESLEAQ